MASVKITKALINNYQDKDNSQMKELSFEVFSNLEQLIEESDNFKLIERIYDETGVKKGIFRRMHDSFGSLKYEIYTNGKKEGQLNIEFFSNFDESYNKLTISLIALQYHTKDKDVVRDLSKIFHSFVPNKK